MRHSHSPEGEFPSDLHVLGLPLAFILSQDQTLHCIIVVLKSFSCLGLRYDSLLFLTLETVRASRPPVSDLCWPQAFKELSGLPSSIPLFRKAENGCKGTTFLQTDKRFFVFFQKNLRRFVFEPPQTIKLRSTSIRP